MKINTYMLCVCLVLAVTLSALTSRSNAQTTRPATKAVQTQSIPTTGGAAVQTDVPVRPENDVVVATEIPAVRTSARPSEKNQHVKAFRAELMEWMQANPENKHKLDATERELYRNKEWTKLYDYRLAKTTSNK